MAAESGDRQSREKVRKGSLADFLFGSPLYGAEADGLVIERERSNPHHRDVDLGGGSSGSGAGTEE